MKEEGDSREEVRWTENLSIDGNEAVGSWIRHIVTNDRVQIIESAKCNQRQWRVVKLGSGVWAEISLSHLEFPSNQISLYIE